MTKESHLNLRGWDKHFD